METHANYVTVGAFVMICLLGLFAALIWIGGSQLRDEYSYFRSYFTGPVTGLGKGTIVRYNGIDVGRVSELQFDAADPKRVVATLQIDSVLRLHADSVASIESQGLTGATYVEIEGGTANAPLLTAKSGEPYPVIPSKPSTLQLLTESGPQMVSSLKSAGDRVGELLNDDNRKAFAETLEHLRATTALLDDHAEDLDAMLLNMRNATQSLNRTLGSANNALGSVEQAAGRFRTASESADNTLQKVGRLSDDADKVINGPTIAQFNQFMTEARTLVTSMRRLSSDLQREPTRLLFGDRRQGYTPQ